MIPTEQFKSQTYTTSDGFCLPYQIRLPQGKGPFPLLLLMHGAGERGRDNQCTLVHFVPLLEQKETPLDRAIILVPQCPSEMRWVEHDWATGSYHSADAPLSPALLAVIRLVSQVIDTLPVDPSRVYVSGISMGGFATWRLLAEYPHLFAAGLPICGGGPLDLVQRLASLPIRTFHCANDDAVPVQGTRELVAAIKQYTPNGVDYTEYPDGGHGAWIPVYADPGQMEWLFSKRK